VAVVEDPEGGAKVKSCPVPLRLTFWGLWAASSAMLRVPVRVLPAAGLKVTEMVQLPPALTPLPQVLLCEKSPLAVMPETASAPLPVLFTVTVCAALLVPDNWAAKVSEAGDKLTTGASPVPVPVTAISCGSPGASSLRVMFPEKVPDALGTKLTDIEQLPPAWI
jgi:hypothetical protein